MRLPILLLTLAVLLPAQVFGQGAIVGTVTDTPYPTRPRALPLPGVTVTVVSESGPPRSVLTGAEGRYEVTDLPAGTYTLTFTLPGLFAPSREVALVSDGATVTVDATLSVGPIEFRNYVPRGPRFPPSPEVTACLHDGLETSAERQRREQALGAMRLIGDVLTTLRPLGSVPSWEELAQSDVVAGIRAETGARGDIARLVRWGESELLPGWGLAWVKGDDEVQYALIDLNDPCAFALSWQDLSGTTPGRRYRIVPLE
jgi:hypothetical protein